jgi:hypothetical protein
MFPDKSGFIRGLQLGAELDDIVESEDAEPLRARDGATFDYDVEDPRDSGRRLTLEVLLIQTRARALTFRFYSTNKIDVDAPYRLIRKLLDKAHGRPAKELSGVLKFIWTLRGSELPSTTSICRFKNDQGINVLEVRTSLQDGFRMPVAGRKPGLAASRSGS